MQPTPIGVIGELCIAGDGVGAGYLNRPELTAEKFIDNPFGEGKLYKTGDLAYWREDGNIAYVGRNDFQVKIRGLRIELGEIENAVDSIDGISQAVVVVRKNSEGRQLICAFYTGMEMDAKEIRNHIGKKLPKYMLPHIFTRIEEMPLTSSGKVNRKALPEVDLYAIDNAVEYVAPENEQQRLLCELAEQVLGVSPIGIADDFFDLGGDSLRAIELISKAHNEGIYMDLQSIFDHPTVKELWESIENGDQQGISFADVDFTEVNKVLEKNKVEHMATPQKRDTGNILLAGATGYLGMHILADYLEHDAGTAYCLVRGKNQEDSTKRLQELLNFYFGNRYADMHRIEVVCADLQKDQFGLPDAEYAQLVQKIHTVINCAASVKHYGSYKYFYEVNVETTKRLIDFCFDADAVLIHTSTMSVSGNSFGDDFSGSLAAEEKTFMESSLYIGQHLDNVYARSKFEAEKAVLDAMTHGLHANIMRMGQLTNRASDGVFQMNHESNAYLKRLKAMLELGVVPAYLLDQYTEFTPIDNAANAVMTIVRHFSDEQTVFHIENPKFVLMGKLIQLFGELGYHVESVSQDAFARIIEELGSDSSKRHILEAFINEIDENNRLSYESSIHIDLRFTTAYLAALGFEWTDIDTEYLRKYVEYFKRIGYLQ
jgi:thioester reductase-like protein